MRLHRFFLTENINGGKIGAQKEFSIESAELTNQIRRVFRLKNADKVIIFDGSGFDFECEIAGGEKDSLNLRVVSSERSHYMPKRDIYLCAAITKKDTFEWIVEKATELGVTHIIPVLAERSEKKSLNEVRLRKIAVEASEQSGRGSVPTILPINNLEQAISLANSTENMKSVAFHTEAELFTDADIDTKSPTFVFIGPEGGWSADEVDLFHKSKIAVKCLGNQVLRAETAVIVALSKVVFSN
ncbi:MAG: RsmE family RNA methyltransferase [Candidatus Taylorbacteria bacterium]